MHTYKIDTPGRYRPIFIHRSVLRLIIIIWTYANTTVKKIHKRNIIRIAPIAITLDLLF